MGKSIRWTKEVEYKEMNSVNVELKNGNEGKLRVKVIRPNVNGVWGIYGSR